MITKVIFPANTVVSAVVEEMHGSPPRILVAAQSQHATTTPFFDSIHWGLYVHALEIIGTVKISNFRRHSEVVNSLERYSMMVVQEQEQNNLPSALVLYLTDAAPLEEDYLSSEIILPAGDLGLALKGFPPIVSKVHALSPIRDLIQVGQRVDRLIIREREINWSLSSGGFTDQRVAKALNEHDDVENGRILVVVADDDVCKKKKYSTGKDKGVNMWFDWGSFQNSSRWSLSRMLSDRPSKCIDTAPNEYSPVKNVTLF